MSQLGQMLMNPVIIDFFFFTFHCRPVFLSAVSEAEAGGGGVYSSASGPR